MLFLCLFPSLLRNSGNKHQNKPLVSSEIYRQSSTYIILYISQQNKAQQNPVPISCDYFARLSAIPVNDMSQMKIFQTKNIVQKTSSGMHCLPLPKLLNPLTLTVKLSRSRNTLLVLVIDKPNPSKRLSNITLHSISENLFLPISKGHEVYEIEIIYRRSFSNETCYDNFISW